MDALQMKKKNPMDINYLNFFTYNKTSNKTKFAVNINKNYKHASTL